jgi:L-ribulose-5-phosphate 4-epimerase
MLEALKKKVLEANLQLPKHNLVTFTWGNASEIDREKNLIVIKPSGIAYENLKESNLVVVDLDGNIVEGLLRPSSDTATHIELYKAFPRINGIVHTHSRWATSYAQAGRSILPMGTTQADYFHGPVPCTRALTDDEIANEYEKNTGRVIAETFKHLDPVSVVGVLVRNHGPFAWGTDSLDAVHNAVVMEEIAFMNFHALMINPQASLASQALQDKHYFRKHGRDAYYGQEDRK